MRLKAIAVDYDGTIATDGVFDPSAREAVADARRRGIAVILATGRRLPELQQVAGSLDCFDVVVAENGAVLHFPLSGRHVVLGHRPVQSVLDDLLRKGLPFQVGETVIETDGVHAQAALDTVRRLEQPLTLSFNRSRLMLLPAGVCKSSGLRQALHALRLSIHNVVAIGDAENDHDLLDACEVGAAAGWGSRALMAVADEVIEGTGPAAVAAFIRRIVSQPRLWTSQMGRRRVMLGCTDAGKQVHLAVRGRTMFIAGEPGTGKSWLAGLICEQLILQGYCMCLIDPEGDYRSLAALPGVVMLGGDEPPPSMRELTRSLAYPDVTVLIDLSKVSRADKVAYLRLLLPALSTLRRRTGLPHKILIDEAHYYLADLENGHLPDAELGGYMFVSYRISALPPSIRATADPVVFVTQETDRAELAALAGMCGRHVLPVEALGNLATNEAALLPGPDEAEGTVRRFRIAPRLTSHVRHRQKYLDMGVSDSQAFVFAGERRARARTLRQFMNLLLSEAPATVEGHLSRHDFSRWLLDVFRDAPLAGRVLAIESQVGRDPTRRLIDDISQTIRARYDTAEERAIA